ncbi:TetR family transcriptional regulator [Paraburkholderia sp. PGU19]|uniref:TetR family transcriptional regulator n=2 Tax=Paraburkholderia TaxID=1822464 RepID=A0A4R0XQN7_9BURK|nr:TetR/AcrR family transcriptional regulator [Paraburkholderia terrae]TCG09799.1 TetR family transcriptional regulator [Paraburkholderia steynii]BCF99927.1 TetR family transcriptional regulator [Paraburkholderia sp. PGU19]AUT62691.1 TetR family transcriptional regulator [Paraburkholderia terrae]MDW3663708.1 TetR family transcriptional regulator C-terminal domain-containing protein [Paraburkholderia terrae]BCZ81665.1 TetR family transcriptional regulator [Paraburkholderia terrae]
MPRPANPQVRSRLLSVGRDVVHDRGFNGCGVQDITTAAGVPKGSFYNYFESKEMFAAEILEDYWQSIEDRHGPILYDARIRPLARIAKFFRALTDDHSKSDFALGCLIGNLSLELSNASDEARSKLLALLARWQEALAACLREAQERNELDRKQNADELAAIVIEAYEGAAMRGKIEQSGNAYERFEKVVLPRLLR